MTDIIAEIDEIKKEAEAFFKKCFIDADEDLEKALSRAKEGCGLFARIHKINVPVVRGWMYSFFRIAQFESDEDLINQFLYDQKDKVVIGAAIVYQYNKHSGIFEPSDLYSILHENFPFCSRLETVTKTKGIVRNLIERHYNVKFFDNAPIGIPCKSFFLKWNHKKSRFEKKPYKKEYRARFKFPFDPDYSKPDKLISCLTDSYGHKERKQIKVLQEVTGVIFAQLAPVFQQGILLLIGPGKNGKTTFKKLVLLFFNRSFVSAIPFQNMDKDRYITELINSVINDAGDVARKIIIPSDIKQLTGNDYSSCRTLYKQEIDEVYLKGFHIATTNELPFSDDSSDGFIRRFVLSEMRFVPETIIQNLDEKLYKEEGEKILGWAIKGAEKVLKRGGIKLRKQNKELSEEWRDSIDGIIKEFIDDCKKTKKPTTNLRTLYENFSNYAIHRLRGRKEVPQLKTFKEALMKRVNYIKKKNNDEYLFYLK